MWIDARCSQCGAVLGDDAALPDGHGGLEHGGQGTCVDNLKASTRQLKAAAEWLYDAWQDCAAMDPGPPPQWITDVLGEPRGTT